MAATCFGAWACARHEAFRAGQTKALSRYSDRRRTRVGTEREGGPETVGWTALASFGGGRRGLALKLGAGLVELVEPNRGPNSAHGEHLIKVNLQIVVSGLGSGLSPT